MYRLDASFSVKLYSYIMVITLFSALVSCPETTVWPSALGSLYPSRPIYQVGVACSLCPYLTYLVLWGMKTKSKNVSIAGFLKLNFLMLSTFVSKADEPKIHGLLEFAYSMVVCYWMLAISWKGRKGSVLYRNHKCIGFREVLFVSYVFAFLYSLHKFSNFFRTGSGYPTYKNLRFVAVVLDIVFDYLNAGEFPGMAIDCSWVHSYIAWLLISQGSQFRYHAHVNIHPNPKFQFKYSFWY